MPTVSVHCPRPIDITVKGKPYHINMGESAGHPVEVLDDPYFILVGGKSLRNQKTKKALVKERVLKDGVPTGEVNEVMRDVPDNSDPETDPDPVEEAPVEEAPVEEAPRTGKKRRGRK